MSETESFIDPIFSKPIYSKPLNIDTKKIVSMLEEYDFHDAGGDISSTKKPTDIENISSASDNLYVLEDKRFKFLKDELMKEFYLFSRDQMKYSNKFEITTSWFTKAEKGQSSESHNHNNCMISGVLYLQTDKNCGNINFQNYDNRRYNINIEEYNIFNGAEVDFPPEDGLLLLFPSEVWHKIEKNKSDTTRYSLAFNLVPTGLIGYGNSDSHLKIKVVK
jgi:uncharacterized protein (TIGR02466 family)